MNPDAPTGYGLSKGLLVVELVDDFADHLLEEILHCHQAGGAAVLIDYDRHMESSGLHISEQVVGLFGLGNEPGCPGQRSDGLTVATLEVSPHQVLSVDDPDDVVDPGTAHRDPAIAVSTRLGHGLGHRQVGTDAPHIRAGHHYLTHQTIAKGDYRRD